MVSWKRLAVCSLITGLSWPFVDNITESGLLYWLFLKKVYFNTLGELRWFGPVLYSLFPVAGPSLADGSCQFGCLCWGKHVDAHVWPPVVVEVHRLRYSLPYLFDATKNQNIKDDKVVLLTGINPSYKENDKPESYSFCFSSAKDEGKSRYWYKKHKQFGATKESNGDLLTDHIAYLDLFPFRETKQPLFEKVFQEFNDFRYDILSVTQKVIHELTPKLIIHANKSSLYYWGLNFDNLQDDKTNPWLGYHFEIIPFNDIPGMKAYEQRVSGIEKRIVHLFRMSGNGIEPCYFLTYMMENYRMKANTRLQLLTPDEMVTLCNYFLK